MWFIQTGILYLSAEKKRIYGFENPERLTRGLEAVIREYAYPEFYFIRVWSNSEYSAFCITPDILRLSIYIEKYRDSFYLINSDKLDYCPFVSFDSKTLIFTSKRHLIPESFAKNRLVLIG